MPSIPDYVKNFWGYVSSSKASSSLEDAFLKWASEQPLEITELQYVWTGVNRDIELMFNKKATKLVIDLEETNKLNTSEVAPEVPMETGTPPLPEELPVGEPLNAPETPALPEGDTPNIEPIVPKEPEIGTTPIPEEPVGGTEPTPSPDTEVGTPKEKPKPKGLLDILKS